MKHSMTDVSSFRSDEGVKFETSVSLPFAVVRHFVFVGASLRCIGLRGNF